MQIIDGYVGTPNIYADVIGEHNISMYGSGDYVLNVGECLGYELISNNEIRIKDGMFITQGRRGYIKKGTTEVCQIDNGAQTGKRNDLIVIEYAKDLSTQVESHVIRVLKGIPGAEASDPEITTGNIPDGAILHQMPLYRVKIEGLNIVAVEQLFEFGSVAAETVDPMLTTEEGFAADALAVKKKFDEQKWKFLGSVADRVNIKLPSEWTELNIIAVGSGVFQFNVPRLHIETFTIQSFHQGFYDTENWYAYCLIKVTKETARIDYIKRNGSVESGKMYVYYK